MVFDYAKGGNFNSWINKNYNKLAWKSNMKVLTNIINGLKNIHQNNVLDLRQKEKLGVGSKVRKWTLRSKLDRKYPITQISTYTHEHRQ